MSNKVFAKISIRTLADGLGKVTARVTPETVEDAEEREEIRRILDEAAGRLISVANKFRNDLTQDVTLLQSNN